MVLQRTLKLTQIFVIVATLLVVSLDATAQGFPTTFISQRPDGTMLVVSNSTTVKILDATTMTTLNTFTDLQEQITAPSWSPDGTRFALASGTQVQIWQQPWNAGAAQLITSFQSVSYIRSLAWSPNGNRIAVAHDQLEMWDVSAVPAVLGYSIEPHNNFMNQVAWSPSGTLLASASIDKTVKIWDAATGSLVSTMRIITNSSAMSPSEIFVPALSVSWSPNDTKLVFGGADGSIRIWDRSILSGAEVGTAWGESNVLQQHQRDVWTVAWSPTGTQIASGSLDGTVRIWNAATYEQLAVIEVGAPVGSVLWSPDGTKLIYSDTTGSVSVVPAPSVSVENGPIVYVSKRDGNFEVYKMNADGSGDTRLTNYGGQDWSPSWSPDGSQIAFMSLRHHSSGEIYTMNPDGSNVVRLTTNTLLDVEPDYSPDGSKIVFVSIRGSSYGELWTMNTDGSGQTLLYDSAGDDNQPVWSPDGSQIAFASNQSGNWEIWVVPSTGGTVTKLTNHSSLDRYPAWSADGSQIAWVSDRTGFDVYTMPATGGTATNISNHAAYDSYPAYSPDGTLMAFTSNRDGDQEVWTMTVAGASPVQLTFNTALEWDPDWVALTSGGEGLLSAPGVMEAAIPDNTPKPEKLNPLPAGISEETHPDLFYVGAWVDEALKGASGESVQTTHSIGGEVWFSFEGTEVILHFVTRPDALPIEVCVDDACQTIDLYSPQMSVTSITLGDLKAGLHTVHISNDSAGYLSLDAVEVPEK